MMKSLCLNKRSESFWLLKMTQSPLVSPHQRSHPLSSSEQIKQRLVVSFRRNEQKNLFFLSVMHLFIKTVYINPNLVTILAGKLIFVDVLEMRWRPKTAKHHSNNIDDICHPLTSPQTYYVTFLSAPLGFWRLIVPVLFYADHMISNPGYFL